MRAPGPFVQFPIQRSISSTAVDSVIEDGIVEILGVEFTMLGDRCAPPARVGDQVLIADGENQVAQVGLCGGADETCRHSAPVPQ